MKSLAEDPNLRKRVGVQAREEVQRNYSLKVLGERLADILKNIENSTDCRKGKCSRSLS